MKYYFASDFHLGIDINLPSKVREQKLVRWLDSIKDDAQGIYLLGDIFDFWFEYAKVIPKGYIHLLGKLAELRSKGIPIYMFTGNHDMWMFDYLQEELDVKIYQKEIKVQLEGKTFILGHGDGIGPGDHGYKLLKKIFASSLCQWFFARLHPNFAMSLGQYFSKKSRLANEEIPNFLGPENEWQIIHAEEKIKNENIDFFIYGHRHIPLHLELSNKKTQFINLGDWVFHFSYAVFDGEKVEVMFFENEDGKLLHPG